MSVTSRRLRSVAAVALAAGLAFGTAACSKNDDSSGDSTDGPVTITLQYFGKPGFEASIPAFQAANPNIKVDVQNMGELKDFQPKLVQWLAAGKGAGDVVMLEEGNLLGFLQEPKNWADLNTLGAKDVTSDYLPFKNSTATTADGKLIALGTDVGPLAMCYRVDLFEKAGLPTKRDEVSALWPTWEAYAQVGNTRFKGKAGNAAWIDSATSIMQPYIMQNSDTWFYSKDNKFIGDSNKVVKDAWDYGLKLASDGLTSKLARWSPDWVAAFKNSAFATQPCPPWMTGVIESNAGPDLKGKWDVATIPGKGGNWGGSFLGVPSQSTKQKQAFELVKYLTGKEGAINSFKAVGALPSNLKALDDTAVTGLTNPYFNNAPTGQIFSASAKTLKPIYLGPKHQALWENVFEPQMQAAEQGKSTPAAAWTKATADGKKLAEG